MTPWLPVAVLAALVAVPVREVELTVRPPARVVIPGGRFVMGATADEVRQAEAACAVEQRATGALAAVSVPRCRGRFDAEVPAGDVLMPAFAIDRTEVTRAAYDACVRAGACRPIPALPMRPSDATLPVDRATFADAVAYCRFRGGRLPTEAEWERAARGSRGPWPWGRAHGGGRANGGHARGERSTDEGPDGEEDASDGFAGLAPVGSFPDGASPFGLVDVAGNVWEWTSGFFAREAPQVGSTFAPHGPAVGDERTIRGGSYLSPPSDQRVSRRLGLAPSERRNGVGFRCAYDVDP